MPNDQRQPLIGIAGLDEQERVRTARSVLGNDTALVGGRCGIAGINCDSTIQGGNLATLGVAGDAHGKTLASMELATALQNRDKTLAAVGRNSGRLGDRTVQQAWKGGCWFADFSYVVKTSPSGIAWREGRANTFSRERRSLPFYMDSAGYRREITHTAPKWAHRFENYLAAIELADPDGFAAWDYPQDRLKTLQYLEAMQRLYPGDPRLWPVYSIRWSWDDSIHTAITELDGVSLKSLIPINRTQQAFKESTRELWARQAVANALKMAGNPDFRRMVETHGKVMIGGMVKGPCPRMARHVFAAVLCKVFPEAQIWLLGQAAYSVINGMGMLGLLDQVWTDGSWWIHDARAERFAIVERKLITMISLEATETEKKLGLRRESFWSIGELMAANLRSLLAAYAGCWEWPTLEWPADLPLKPLAPELAGALDPHIKRAYAEMLPVIATQLRLKLENTEMEAAL